jgi:subtilisin family serine protease
LNGLLAVIGMDFYPTKLRSSKFAMEPNPGESGVDAKGLRKETNGVDDDHNGYVDDVVGWDFAFNDPDPDAYVFDGMDSSRIQPYWHSMSAMGIIGAKGNNNVGVAGLNWDVSMMLLKIGAQGIKRDQVDLMRAPRAAKAIRYAVDNGAKVINWSGFISDYRPEVVANLKSAFEYAAAHGVLIVIAAGNQMKDLDNPANTVYPASFETDNTLVVAELAVNGQLDEFSGNDRISGSNYGLHRVHIAALGSNFTTDVRNGVSVYRTSGGTSNAAPVVTGVAALVLSVRPNLKAGELKQILMESSTKLPSLEGKIASGGLVNAYRAVKLAMAR